MKSDLQRIFATRLAALMEERELSANALGKASGVAQRSISRILKGEQDPSLEVVDRLCRSLGLPPIYLLTAAGPIKVSVDKSVRKIPSPYPSVFSSNGVEKKSRSSKRKRE